MWKQNAILILTLFSVLFSSCKKDDDNGNPNPNTNPTDPCANTTLAITVTPGEERVSVAATGGKTPYSYSISTDSANYSNKVVFTDLTPGTYTVYVKDSIGCIKSATATVTPPPTTFTDSRDNQTYSMVKIGNQTWMAENLNYQTTKTSTDSSYCYESKDDSCAKYGKLYTYGAAVNACPTGWHLPTETEFNELKSYLDNEGGQPTISKLLEGGSSGFNVKLAGWYTGSKFDKAGLRTAFWYNSDSNKALSVNTEANTLSTSAFHIGGISIRCIKTVAP